MSDPLVSVIVPVYNTGEMVQKTIKSILDNTYKNVEIIVVDDGSNDITKEVLKKIKSECVKVYEKENGGPSSARNFGIEKARGEYLIFVDSDDEIKLEFIEKLVKAIRPSENVLAMSGIVFRSEASVKEEFIGDFPRKNDEDIKKYILRSLLKDGRMYPVFNKIFRSEIVKKDIRFDEGMRFGEDTKFVLDYVEKCVGKIIFVPEALYIHNMDTKTSIAKAAVQDWRNWEKSYINIKSWVKECSVWHQTLVRLLYMKWRYTWLKSRLFG